MILSTLETAIAKPISTCALSLALSRSNLVRPVITSSLNSTKEEMNSLIFINFGLPLVKARELTPYELCKDENLYNLFSTTCEITPFFNSTTTLTPCLSDSSLKSLMPSIFLSLTNSAIFSSNNDLFTWYGISEKTIDSRSFLNSSISYFACTTIEPRPDFCDSLIPFVPKIIPPVGKSGPLMKELISSKLISGFFMNTTQASITSPKL